MRLTNGIRLSKAAPIIRKGVPIPIENTSNRYAPCQAVSVLKAIAKILPRMGLIQGVQARVNMAPIRKERR